MAIYLLTNDAAKTVKKTKNLIVQAVSAAHAKIFAASHFNGDGSWADATATTLTASTLDEANCMAGFVFKTTITGGTQTEDPIVISYTGGATDDLDAVAEALVLLYNAHAEIDVAVYNAPALTVADIGSGMGDASLTFEVFPPSGNTAVNIGAIFQTGVTDEGIAGAVLEVALVADTVATPSVLAEV